MVGQGVVSYHSVDAEEWIMDKFGFRPLARLDAVARLDMSIDFRSGQSVVRRRKVWRISHLHGL